MSMGLQEPCSLAMVKHFLRDGERARMRRVQTGLAIPGALSRAECLLIFSDPFVPRWTQRHTERTQKATERLSGLLWSPEPLSAALRTIVINLSP